MSIKTKETLSDHVVASKNLYFINQGGIMKKSILKASICLALAVFVVNPLFGSESEKFALEKVIRSKQCNQKNSDIFGSFWTTTKQTVSPGDAIVFDQTNVQRGIKVNNSSTSFRVREGGLFQIEFEVAGNGTTGDSVPVDLFINDQPLNQPITIPDNHLLDSIANPLISTLLFIRLDDGDSLSVRNTDSTDQLFLTDGTSEDEPAGITGRLNIFRVR